MEWGKIAERVQSFYDESQACVREECSMSESGLM